MHVRRALTYLQHMFMTSWWDLQDMFTASSKTTSVSQDLFRISWRCPEDHIFRWSWGYREVTLNTSSCLPTLIMPKIPWRCLGVFSCQSHQKSEDILNICTRFLEDVFLCLWWHVSICKNTSSEYLEGIFKHFARFLLLQQAFPSKDRHKSTRQVWVLWNSEWYLFSISIPFIWRSPRKSRSTCTNTAKAGDPAVVHKRNY